MQVQSKEATIKRREEEKGCLKSAIEVQKNDQEDDFSKLRATLDEQKQLISNQRKLLNELQVLNEMTQTDITKASQDLSRKLNEKDNLNL